MFYNCGQRYRKRGTLAVLILGQNNFGIIPEGCWLGETDFRQKLRYAKKPLSCCPHQKRSSKI